jgi:hypothetical protein
MSDDKASKYHVSSKTPPARVLKIFTLIVNPINDGSEINENKIYSPQVSDSADRTMVRHEHQIFMRQNMENELLITLGGLLCGNQW